MTLDPPDPSAKPSILTQGRPHLRHALESIVKICEDDQVPLSIPTRNQLKRVRMLLDQAPSVGPVVIDNDYRMLADQARHFRNTLLDDLEGHWFYFIPAPDRELMDASRAHFGAEVPTKFPDAIGDISAAARCLALREGTACVFHLMRALEHALHELARSLSISMAPTVDLENWKNILDQIEVTIQQERKALLQQPKGHAKDQRLQVLGEIALQLGYFKDAWRNHVSHARKTYDPDQARSVWSHVHEFMRKMADVV